MPDLHTLLTEAAPPVQPGFDESDVRARVGAADRRRRRTGVGSMVAAVALVGALVVSVLMQPDGVRPDGMRPVGQGELIPLSQWPSTFDFAGVEIGVYVADEPDEVMQSRIQLGEGEAALNIDPSDAVEPGNLVRQLFVPRVWFGCGTGQIIRLQEIGPAAGAQVSQSGRWLPPGGLVEAARQLTVGRGCRPAAPEGTPRELGDNQPELHQLAAAIDAAGLSTCCALPNLNPQSNSSTPDPSDAAQAMAQWGVVIDGQALSLTIGTVAWVPVQMDPVRREALAGGAVAVGGSATVAASCFFDTFTAPLAPEDMGRLETFLVAIGCTPSVPITLGPNAALATMLGDLGGEVVASPWAQAIAQALVVVEGLELQVTSGGTGQVGLSPDTVIELNRGWQALDPAVDGDGAVAQCGVTHAIRALTPAGTAAALALAERIVAHPDCSLDSGFEIPTTPADPDPPGETIDEPQPLASFPPEAQTEILANQFEQRLHETGFTVTREHATRIVITPPTMLEVQIAMEVALADRVEPPDGSQSVEVGLGGGVALLDDVAPGLIFGCDEALVNLSRERTDEEGGRFLQTFLDAAGEIAEALPCTPDAPAT